MLLYFLAKGICRLWKTYLCDLPLKMIVFCHSHSKCKINHSFSSRDILLTRFPSLIFGCSKWQLTFTKTIPPWTQNVACTRQVWEYLSWDKYEMLFTKMFLTDTHIWISALLHRFLLPKTLTIGRKLHEKHINLQINLGYKTCHQIYINLTESNYNRDSPVDEVFVLLV